MDLVSYFFSLSFTRSLTLTYISSCALLPFVMIVSTHSEISGVVLQGRTAPLSPPSPPLLSSPFCSSVRLSLVLCLLCQQTIWFSNSPLPLLFPLGAVDILVFFTCIYLFAKFYCSMNRLTALSLSPGLPVPLALRCGAGSPAFTCQSPSPHAQVGLMIKLAVPPGAGMTSRSFVPFDPPSIMWHLFGWMGPHAVDPLALAIRSAQILSYCALTDEVFVCRHRRRR
ncbi:uncharacterized protein BJ171DRAFT_239106 [Polychytrium aggregatum]|uniref:uncharacterized protein n=1 Tax=Polychytrium aggregatum TaxID=110093 RepID=UPI0022FDEA36|nr:uncharacterized protein BJ171DRAFT_198349 [Polychytrium aggregatum]XP_052970468.1 uncharacterized protein BJ171DRAFT_239106 [Polychytrium aggregatum]KAI9199771.1 hypothetical protein BJ171DRAFT_198349 [Polychytrium aggregatum]KAI9208388.1 hypothetical protein BJ171DRAFT_239106 [Polychytrium aggregatum]